MTSTPDAGSAAPDADAAVAEDAVAPVADAAAMDADAAVAEDAVAPVADPRLLDAHALALVALHEITPAATVGAAAGYTLEPDGVVSLRFDTTLAGYPGWFWTVSVAVVPDADPTVLEVELLPGDDALLAPDWVPWAVRLADYQAAQTALAEAGDEDSDAESDDAESDEELEELEDLDATDFDVDASPILHSGDVDGVDIDVLDESDDAFDDDADSETEDADSETDDADLETDDADLEADDADLETDDDLDAAADDAADDRDR